MLTHRPSPLGLYVFSQDSSVTEQILSYHKSRAMLTLTTARSNRRFTICHSVASETLGWANIMANGDSAPTQTRAAFYRMAQRRIDIGGLRYPPYEHNRILREIVMPS